MVTELSLTRFMAHLPVHITDIPALNVIIGKNDTGKTGLLKVIYASLKAVEIYGLKQDMAGISFKKELSDKVYQTFMPRILGDLVQKGSNGKLEVSLSCQHTSSFPISYSFGDRTESLISPDVDPPAITGFNALFIPAKEVLTAFNDIRATRENFYGKGFDDTYLDLIKALSLPTAPGRMATSLSQINHDLEMLFDGSIQQTRQHEQPFIFKRGRQEFSMSQTAEGIKKIGILSTLLRNKQLAKGTVLFLDEPETALHPQAIRQLVDMLVRLSMAGVQIFAATHSYFFLKELALQAKRLQTDALCWNLQRPAGEFVSTQFSNLKDGILPDNDIVKETLAMYKDELTSQLQ